MPDTAVVSAPKKTNRFLNEDREPRFWTLYYRYGNIVMIEKSFEFDGTLEQATLRGRKHCELMRFKFLCVRPMIVDLDYQEQKFLEGRLKGDDV